MADTASRQLLEMWRRQIEEGGQAWLKMLGQGQPVDPADPAAFWRPFMDQSMAAWATVMTQGPPSADLMGQWKQFLDQWIAAWSKVLEQAMGTEAFARALGAQLDAYLTAVGPAKQAAEQHVEATLSSLGVPSRSQVVALAKQVVGVEEKVIEVADRVDELAGLRTRLEVIERKVDAVLKRLEEAAGAPGPGRG